MFTRNEIQPVILTDKNWVAWQQTEVFILTQFQSAYQPEWVEDPFAPKFYSLIQNNINPNFGDGLKLVRVNTPSNHLLLDVVQNLNVLGVKIEASGLAWLCFQSSKIKLLMNIWMYFVMSGRNNLI